MTQRILIVDDDRVFRLIVSKTLLSTQAEFEITEAASADECLEILQTEQFDSILLDYELGDTDGIQMLQDILSRQQQYTPIIMISAHDDDQLMYRCLQHGAQDYLVKDEVQKRTLLRSIRYAEERSQILRKLEELANFDSLTGLANRAFFMRHLKSICSTSDTLVAALFFIDIDDFKPINDNLGHEAGDQVLREVAKRLKTAVRSNDFVARLGGDEFAVVMLLRDNNGNLQRRAQSLLDAITQPFKVAKTIIHISCSIGSACFPEDATKPNDLLRKADEAMYQSKRRGKNGWLAYTKGQMNGINDKETTATTIVSGTPIRTKSTNL